MASPAFFKLSPEATEIIPSSGTTDQALKGGDTNGDIFKGFVLPPPKTHDTSRIGWHMKDLEYLAKNIESAQDHLGVAKELNDLSDIFSDQYGFNVETWQIPLHKSHTNLTRKALDFLDDYDSEENLFILYYAGHGFINQDRQSTWACTPDAGSPTVDWSHIQSSFERAKSDVLVLLDCCAAASSAPRGGEAIMETIAACGFEGRAPPPGEHSFTTSLIEVLHDWVNAPSFSVAMLHSEVLRVLMRRRKERCRNGQKLEWRSTPVHMSNFTHPRTIGIELCKRALIDADSFEEPRSQLTEDLLHSDLGLTSATYLDLMSLSCDALDEKLKFKNETTFTQVSGVSILEGDISAEVSPTLKLPHMLISITLDQDQPLPNPEAARRWICSFPGLSKHVRVEGIFASYSSVLILSIPVVIWNMLPDNPACQPIAYVNSINLILDPVENFFNSKSGVAQNYTQPRQKLHTGYSKDSSNNQSTRIHATLAPFKALLGTSWKGSQGEISHDDEQKTNLEAGYPHSADGAQNAIRIDSQECLQTHRWFKYLHSIILTDLQIKLTMLERKLFSLPADETSVGINNIKRELLQQIQEKLIAYNNLLLSYYKLNGFSQPTKKSYLEWFSEVMPFSKEQYDGTNPPDDFISLSPQSSIARVEEFVKRLLTRLDPTFKFGRIRSSDQFKLAHFKSRTISALARLVALLLAASTLFLPTIVFQSMPNPEIWITRVVVTSCFIFMLLESLLSKAKTNKVLFRTALYCALLSTFLGNYSAAIKTLLIQV